MFASFFSRIVESANMMMMGVRHWERLVFPLGGQFSFLQRLLIVKK